MDATQQKGSLKQLRGPFDGLGFLISFISVVKVRGVVSFITLLLAYNNCSPRSSQSPNDFISHYERNGGKERVIVFVHGIYADARTGWTCPRTKAYWPQLILSDGAFADYDVYVAGYKSSPFGNHMTIDEIATNLSNRLQSDRVFSHPEVVFVCHSVGGMIVQRLLLSNPGYADRVPLIFFFSTPQSGTDLAKLAHLLSSDPVLDALLPGNENAYLLNLENEFKTMYHKTKKFCAYETIPTMGMVIADRLSATRLCDETPIPINSNHVDVVKPCDKNADSYIALKNAVEKNSIVSRPHAAEDDAAKSK